MKKTNNKGFTLIELLAVITIMGILMVVASGAYSRITENTRKDTFVDTAKKYTEGTKTMWAADNLSCGGYVSSAVNTGTYYVEIDSSSNSVPHILESGGKSSWGNRNIKGYIKVVVADVTTPGPDGKTGIIGGVDYSKDDVINRQIKYYPVLTDDLHGINFNGAALNDPLVEADKLVRGSVEMSKAKYTAAAIPAGGIKCVEA